ncbi:MAG: 2-amino-4-hydroxy-6-hydroxymethyldihydropteridine diphosphokinase [Bacteroides sp.]|nr:2-amino-4-hydroxy-6-hydroxymethyldihydropteridine diphosphokinase [Bacteroides sp.]
MATVYLGLGSNLGDKEENLYRAIRKIEERVGKVISRSAFYHTEPWGFESRNTFVNAAIGVDTLWAPEEVLKHLRGIEREMGRLCKTSGGKYADRIIDLDILLYDALVYESPGLSIPHPLMTERKFVLEPLAEIAPDLIHPVWHQSIRDLLPLLTDQQPAD